MARIAFWLNALSAPDVFLSIIMIGFGIISRTNLKRKLNKRIRVSFTLTILINSKNRKSIRVFHILQKWQVASSQCPKRKTIRGKSLFQHKWNSKPYIKWWNLLENWIEHRNSSWSLEHLSSISIYLCLAWCDDR